MSLVPVQHTPFDVLVKQADTLAQSRIIPRAYQRQPADVVAAGLAGQAFGWDVMTSLRNIHVIEGSASLRPEAMLGLVRRAGHSVVIEIDGTNPRTATATGKRSDNGDSHTATFSTEDAKVAGLIGKKNWTQYQDAMLTWRAVSKLCRFLFPDVVLGAGYTPEEIGADVAEDGMPVADFVTPAAAKTELLEACGGDRDLAKDIWGERGSESITQDELLALVNEATEVVSLAQGNAGMTAVDDEPDEIEDAEVVSIQRALLGSKAKTGKTSEVDA